MNSMRKDELRGFMTELLRKVGDHVPPSDSDSLFVSGRLDSLAMMTLVVHLENAFGIDFADGGFEMDLLDTLDDIETLIDEKLSA